MFESTRENLSLEYQAALTTARAMDLQTLQAEIDRLHTVLGVKSSGDTETLQAYETVLEEKHESHALQEVIAGLHTQNLLALSSILTEMLDSEYYELVWDTKRLVDLFSIRLDDTAIPNVSLSEEAQTDQRVKNLHAYEVQRLRGLIGEVSPEAAQKMNTELRFYLTMPPAELLSHLDKLHSAILLRLKTNSAGQ